MKYALNLSSSNRILSATFDVFTVENHVIVDTLPDGNISDYLYVNGEYVYDPIPVEESVSSEEILSVLLGVNV